MPDSFLKKSKSRNNRKTFLASSYQSTEYTDNSGNSYVLHLLILNKNLTMNFSICNHWSDGPFLCLSTLSERLNDLWLCYSLFQRQQPLQRPRTLVALFSRKTCSWRCFERNELCHKAANPRSSTAPSFCSSVVQTLSVAVCGESGSQARSSPQELCPIAADTQQQNLLTWGRTIHQTHTPMCLASWTLVPASHPLLADTWQTPPTAASLEPSFRRQGFLMDALIVCFQNTVTSMWKIGSSWLASYENKFQCLETEHNFKCYHPANHVLPLLVFHFSGMNLGQFCICPIYFIYTCSLYLHTQMGDICLFSFGQAIVLLKWKCAGFGIQLQHMFENER